MKYTKSQVQQISQGEATDIADFISMLLTHIDQQEKTIERLDILVKELERPVGTDSRNSSKPPSSWGFRKTKSQRPSGGKKDAQGARQAYSEHVRCAGPD